MGLPWAFPFPLHEFPHTCHTNHIIWNKEADVASELRLSEEYRENVRLMDETFSVEDNFDLIKKVISVGPDELTLYYIDGFVKDGSMTKILIYQLGLDGLKQKNADEFMRRHMPYVEAEVTQDGEANMRT